MTEQELRKQAVDLIRSWVGAPKGSNTHHQIIDIYNSHKPLPRGIRMSYSMEWCAATVSAVGIALGLTDIMPVECSCGELIKHYKALWRWVEDDAYVPQPGDLILYDWDDNGKGDNVGAPEHVGMVTNVDGNTITVVEGNMGSPSRVGTRTLQVNGRYIRGYCCPDYASKADKPPVTPPELKEPWYTDAQAWAVSMGIAKGTDNGLQPEAPCTRAEVWAMLKRYHEAAGAARGGE